MAEKMIKYRLFTYFEETENLAGDVKLRERQASFGEVVEIESEEDLERGERLGAFFTDEEREAIEDGSYTGPEADLLRRSAMLVSPDAALVEGDEGETIDVSEASADEIAEYIQANKLNVSQTVALAGDDADLAEKVLDAEGIVAANNSADPRKGVDEGLQAVIDAAGSQE
jgi:hypothetical protein